MADDVKQAALKPGPANAFLRWYLQLCVISYLEPGLIANEVTWLRPYNPEGGWSCPWGPALNKDQSNLAFVAVYATAGTPILASLVIRGTDVQPLEGWGAIQQIWEDIDVAHQVPLPWAADTPPRIAQGTLEGLHMLESLSSNGKSLLDFLQGFLGDPANRSPALAVTGHSLGGCLASVAAPWLRYALGQAGLSPPIFPVTFAAPSAGNADFASLLASLFPASLRCYNTLDIVPMAWEDLAGIKTIYDACGSPAPEIVRLGIDGFIEELRLARVAHAQPASNGLALNGRAQSAVNWYDQLLCQHHTLTYMSLLGGAPALPLFGGTPVAA